MPDPSVYCDVVAYEHGHGETPGTGVEPSAILQLADLTGPRLIAQLGGLSV